jgi:NADPH:quinone reductase-like Zn-dependent oxidoreductase
VEATGKNATRFRPGDEVFGESLRGYSWRNGGAFAEYASVPEEGLEFKPPP